MTVTAMELGGSHASAARVDTSEWAVHDVVRLELDPAGARDDLLAVIAAAARSVADGATRVGVATPGPFDYERGICTIAGVAKLDALFGVDLRAELARVFVDAMPLDIRFVNDAEAFLLGEAVAGAARGCSRAIGVTLGTGLGSAFLVDGRIVRAGPGVPPDGELHRVQFRGAEVEDTVSGRGLARRFGSGADGKRIAELAAERDARATAAYASLGDDLAEFLAPWVRDFAPDAVVVGGSMARAWAYFGPALDAGLDVPTWPAERLDDAALLGAALHAVPA
jgi:predicted NBD/HSP70 family sugar kinase